MWDMYYGAPGDPNNPDLYNDYEQAMRGQYIFKLYEYSTKDPATGRYPFRLEIVQRGDIVFQAKYTTIDAAKDRAEKFVADNSVWL